LSSVHSASFSLITPAFTSNSLSLCSSFCVTRSKYTYAISCSNVRFLSVALSESFWGFPGFSVSISKYFAIDLICPISASVADTELTIWKRSSMIAPRLSLERFSFRLVTLVSSLCLTASIESFMSATAASIASRRILSLSSPSNGHSENLFSITDILFSRLLFCPCPIVPTE